MSGPRRRTEAGDTAAFERCQRRLARRQARDAATAAGQVRQAAYQYAVRLLTGRSDLDADRRPERQPSRSIAEAVARDWAISEARTAPRTGELLRRRGWDGRWDVVATWTSPEGHA